jgi:hypothetical protein
MNAGPMRNENANSTEARPTMHAHLLAVAVFKIQIKLVLAKKFEKKNSVWTIISMRWAVALRKLGREVLVVHTFAQNIDLKSSIKKLLHLLKIHEPFVHTTETTKLEQ